MVCIGWYKKSKSEKRCLSIFKDRIKTDPHFRKMKIYKEPGPSNRAWVFCVTCLTVLLQYTIRLGK